MLACLRASFVDMTTKAMYVGFIKHLFHECEVYLIICYQQGTELGNKTKMHKKGFQGSFRLTKMLKCLQSSSLSSSESSNRIKAVSLGLHFFLNIFY